MSTTTIYTAPKLEDKGTLVKNTLGKNVSDIEGGTPPHLFDA